MLINWLLFIHYDHLFNARHILMEICIMKNNIYSLFKLQNNSIIEITYAIVIIFFFN